MSATPSSSAAPLLPRDARLIALLLAANGAEDCEEGVVRMLVEFAHRYTTDVLTDSLMYAEHAKSGSTATTANITPSLDDVRLAVQARTEGASVPKEFLLQLATTVNANPLPPVPEVYGIRLPPPAQRLTAPNFTLVPRSAKPPAPPALAGLDGSLPAAATGGEGSNLGTGALGTAEATPAGGQDDDDDSEGLFGDDVSGDDDDDDDDEDMEDVTAGLGGSGAMDGGQNGASGGEGSAGQKRKPDSDDEEYD
ncbi:transcription initiation factor IID, 31kD subunit-domain-containing protein [Leucosporidium creatinivorum]|uniref:Transcription initiation factor IID, 31kD subunit-domain-containing protein n=1 Tax=Leucosporidium creatinivorum TaxID=106004 RepID=A0A1Y2G4P3_9BASI|nr:transcription initiation factor IID, 31kD subunit-domain-containing protein [Leucosporidium creatinivorum]